MSADATCFSSLNVNGTSLQRDMCRKYSSPGCVIQINKSSFSKMQNQPIIINTSRGSVVNENDLIEAYNQNLISGFALDVFENEPITNDLYEKIKPDIFDFSMMELKVNQVNDIYQSPNIKVKFLKVVNFILTCLLCISVFRIYRPLYFY